MSSNAARVTPDEDLATEIREAAFLRSSFYERMVEHVFVAELLQEVFFATGETVEVLRSEVDAAGYDLVVEHGDVVRHVQLKTSRRDARTASQKVHVQLAAKSAGCVVWLVRDERVADRRIDLSYLYFGGGPKEPLPPLDGFRVARHTKANAEGYKAERPSVRVVPKSRFEPITTTAGLAGRLFGLAIPDASPAKD